MLVLKKISRRTFVLYVFFNYFLFYIFNPIVLLKFFIYIQSAVELKQSTFFNSLHAGTFIMCFLSSAESFQN